MKSQMAAFAAMALFAAPVGARAVKIVEPLPAALLGADHVVKVDVTVGESARKTFDALEQKAAGKRTAANLPAADPAATRPVPDLYPTLPFAQMFPLVVDDELTQWGLTSGRNVRLAVQIDTLKTADAGMALLFGSIDQLAGLVDVYDADSGDKLGEFYVDVLNSRAGLLGLAMRGAGVREKLSAEFAKHLGEVLSGRKSKAAKPAKAS